MWGRYWAPKGFDLAEFYRDNGLQAYQSTSVPGLPNRFMLVGPYSWTGTSFHYILENSMRHIEAVLKLARARRATWVEVTQEALDDFQASISRSGANLNRYFTVNCAGSTAISSIRRAIRPTCGRGRCCSLTGAVSNSPRLHTNSSASVAR